jgi:hypothetical protein
MALDTNGDQPPVAVEVAALPNRAIDSGYRASSASI